LSFLVCCDYLPTQGAIALPFPLPSKDEAESIYCRGHPPHLPDTAGKNAIVVAALPFRQSGLDFFSLIVKRYVTMKMLSRRSAARTLGIAAMLLGAALLANGQAKDSLLGTWNLERGKSTFDPDNTLQSRTVIFEARDGGFSFVQKTVTAAGNTVQSDYAAKYDNKDNPISGSQLDTVALKRVNANVVERAGKIKGQVVETVTMTVSNGGKTMTMVTKGSIEDNDYSSTQVFEKQ
jgi:hypothetical protein